VQFQACFLQWMQAVAGYFPPRSSPWTARRCGALRTG
jgi:hypothetical protein